MQSMLTTKPSDDPHDIVAIAPDAIRMAPADEEIESLLKEVHAPSAPSLQAVPPDLSTSATVPPVDITFRATAGNDMLVNGGRSMVGRLMRGVAALLLAACIGGAAMAWRYHGDAAQQLIAEWAPLFAGKSSPSEKAGLAAPPVLAAAEVDAANAAPAQPPAQTAAEAAAPAPVASSDEPQSLQTMARDFAKANQEIEQLKASVEQLKASQQQVLAMVTEKGAAPNLRPKKPAQPAPPPRPVAALTPARAPTSALPPRPPRPAAAPVSSAAAAPYPPPAPYAPRQIEPPSHSATETLNDPELAAVPRPPMPLR
jgi:hypothetical protein